MNTKTNKLICLIGTMIAQIGLGTFYTWSLVNKPLALAHGWDINEVVLSFSIASLSLAVSTLFSNKLQRKFNLKRVVIVCGCLLGVALILAPNIKYLPLLYLCSGVLLGATDGIAYILTLSNILRWFPDKKGLISGIAVGCYGVGSILFSKINGFFFSSFNVHIAFALWGVSAAVLILIGISLIKEAPMEEEASSKIGQKVYTVKDLFSTKQTYLLFIAFFGSCVTGLYLVGSAATMGVNLGHLSLSMAGTTVLIVAIFNTLGRIVFGFLSDKFGRNLMASTLFSLLIVSLLILAFVKLNFVIFLLAAAIVALCFGGGFTIYPSIVGDYYGLQNHSRNYGIVYQCFGVAGIFSGVVGAMVNSYRDMFLILLGFCILSLIIMIFIRAPREETLKEKKEYVSKNIVIPTKSEKKVVLTMIKSFVHK